MDDERFDGLFMNVTQQAQGIEGFLNAFFGFLRRKTDYFTNVSGAQELLQKQFNLHAHAYSEQKEKEEARKRKREQEKRQQEELRRKREEQKQSEEPKVVEITDEEAEAIQQGVITEQQKSPPKAQDDDSDNEEKKDPEDDLPVPINNGGITDLYFWSQTLGEVSINFYIDASVRGRDCQVDFGPEMLRVKIKGETVLDGEFYKKVKPDSLIWTIDTVDKQRVLNVNVDKYEGMGWWKAAIKGGPEINTKKIQAEESKLGDLDDDCRQTVEKMMEDQRRKQMGLPSIEEQEKRDKLKSFMDAHPEMDFSKCKFN